MRRRIDGVVAAGCLAALLLLGGCMQETSELWLNPDGSGRIEQTIILSDRVMVGASDDGPGGPDFPVTIEEVREQIGEALTITSLEEKDLEDGGRRITLAGTFASAKEFFLSGYCGETLKLRLEPAGEGKLSLIFEGEGGDEGEMSIGANQLYGLAKGMHIRKTVHLPGAITETDGTKGEDGRTVTWEIDLRDRKGLERSRRFLEGDETDGRAVFPASSLKVKLPLVDPAAVTEDGTSAATGAGEGFVVTPTYVQWNKVTVLNDEKRAGSPGLTIGLKLKWPEGKGPVAVEPPVLTALADDKGTDLVEEKRQRSCHRQGVSGGQDDVQLQLSAKTPAPTAKALRGLAGTVKVVLGVETEKVVLKDVAAVAGRPKTGNATLDRLGCRIKKVEGSEIALEMKDIRKRIKSISIVKGDERSRSNESFGWDKDFTYGFKKAFAPGDGIELEVVTEEKVAVVPFASKEIALP